MKSNGYSEHHQNNNPKVAIAFANFLGADITFYDINKKEQIIAFLDTKMKTSDQDPDKRCHYMESLSSSYQTLF